AKKTAGTFRPLERGLRVTLIRKFGAHPYALTASIFHPARLPAHQLSHPRTLSPSPAQTHNIQIVEAGSRGYCTFRHLLSSRVHSIIEQVPLGAVAAHNSAEVALFQPALDRWGEKIDGKHRWQVEQRVIGGNLSVV